MASLSKTSLLLDAIPTAKRVLRIVVSKEYSNLQSSLTVLCVIFLAQTLKNVGPSDFAIVFLHLSVDIYIVV